MKIITFILPFLLVACSSTPDSPMEYLEWAKDNQELLFQQQQSEGYAFELQYRPIPQIIGQELDDLNDKEKYNNRYQELKGLQYYNLYVRPLKAKGMSTINQNQLNQPAGLSRYLSYEMQKDLYLVENKDSLPCVLFHFESYADLNKKNNFVLAFPRRDTMDLTPKTIVLKPSVFNQQPISFTYNQETLTQIPALSWQK